MTKDEVMEGVLRDWERLKKFENNVRAVYQGRDLLGEIEDLKKQRDGWSRIAVEAQTTKKKAVSGG